MDGGLIADQAMHLHPDPPTHQRETDVSQRKMGDRQRFVVAAAHEPDRLCSSLAMCFQRRKWPIRWFSGLGQRGTNGTKICSQGGACVLFTELMRAIRPHLCGEMDTPDFVRDMLERLSAVPETLWFTSRDKAPGKDHADATLRKFYSRGISKTLARRMLKQPTRAEFVDSLNYVDNGDFDSAEEVKEALAEVIADFTDEDVDASNVGEILFDLFQRSFEFIVNPELENDRKIQQARTVSTTLKGSYGSRLLEECKHTCSRSGCGQHLQTPASDNKAAPLFEIARIAGKSRQYDNLLALCESCFQSYVLGHKKADETGLKKIKQAQIRSADARRTLSTVDIERGIIKVIEKLGNANGHDFEPLNFEPVAIKDKLDERTEFFLYDEVVRHVTRFYRFIEHQMQEEAKLNTFDDDLLRAQIKALSKKLIAKGYGKAHVHDDLTRRLAQITKQDERYCAYVISYFVQSCEVFDAAS